jgi:hypothetical protein
VHVGQEACTAKGQCIQGGSYSGRGYVCIANVQTPYGGIRGYIHAFLCWRAITRACMGCERRVYMVYPPHLKLPSLFLMWLLA